MINRVYYFIVCVFSSLLRNDEIRNKYFRKRGVKVGKNCHIYSDIVTSEPYLIKIGDGVTISTGVTMVTHDNSIIKCDRNCPNLFGYIEIGDNCFIGEKSILMYGVRIPKNTIIAAGSVVVNSISESNTIWGGNPARVISSWNQFIKRNRDKAISRNDVKEKTKTNPEMFIVRKTKGN